METDLFASNEPTDLNKLHKYLSDIVSRKCTKPQRQMPMDLMDRTNLIESRTSAYCDLIKLYKCLTASLAQIHPTYSSIEKTSPTSWNQSTWKSRKLTLSSVWMMQTENITNFHHLWNTQTQPIEEEVNNKHISTLMTIFDAEAENIKWKMKATMRANSQADSSTDDNRSSMGSYKGKSTKGGKQTTYCSICSELGHNASKCKIKHTLFCDFYNKQTHSKSLQIQDGWTKHLCTLQTRSKQWTVPTVTQK